MLRVAACLCLLASLAPGLGVSVSHAQSDALADARQHGWQGTPGRNLLYNPDMELGGTGYFYDFSWPRQYSSYLSTIKASPTRLLAGKGVEGGTCAWVRGSTLRGYCFPVAVGKTYTISADLRAAEGDENASCTVMAFDSEWNNALTAKASRIPGSKWQRYHWTIKWTKQNIQGRGYVRFDSDSVLVDRIQVAEGELAEYEAPPVMLGLITGRFAYFVRGRDAAKATIRVVPGKPQAGSAAVEAVARDAWGREAWRRSLEAPLDKVTEVAVDLPTEKLGNFHVELIARIAGEVAGIGVSRYAIIDPAATQKVAPGRPGLAGICQETFNFPRWLCEDHARIHGDLGVRFNRFFASIPPDLPQPIPAVFTDELLAKCKPFTEAGIDLMPCVGVIPEEAAKTSQSLEMPSAEMLQAFGDRLREYASGLKSQVRYWEIFNEPNLWRMTSGPDQGKRTMYPAKYLEFQKAAYKTIKEIDPSLQVVCNALNNVQWDWIEQWLAAGGGRYMDAMSFHPYSVTNFIDQGTRLRQVMRDAGFTGPVLNSEKYYGANLFYDRAGYEETRRDYYLPHDGELATAGRSIQHFVSSAAHRIPVCFFNPWGTLSRRGPENELFIYDFFPAYNAAIRFMVDAGYGEKVEMGASVSAILFADAAEGPLLVVWSPATGVNALLKLGGDFAAYDIMGNPADKRLGVRVASDPSYVRYRPGTPAASIRAELGRAEVAGLAAPLAAEVAITTPRQLSAYVSSTGNRPISGQVRLLALPEGWKAARPTVSFSDLRPGGVRRVDFELQSATVENLRPCVVSFAVESSEGAVRKDVSLRPLFVRQNEGIKADGDLQDWRGVQWLPLGSEHLSFDFNTKLKHAGDDDLSAKVATAWSEKYFAVAVVVKDDLQRPGESPVEGWRGDSVQLYFGWRRAGGEGAGGRRDEVHYTLSRIGESNYAWLDKGAEGNFKGAANKVDGLNDADVELAIRREGNETVYEAVFPRERCLPGAGLADGQGLGFSLLVNDNDGQGRKMGVTLAPKGGQPYGHPEQYLNLIFLPAE